MPWPSEMDNFSHVSPGQVITSTRDNAQADALNAIESELGLNPSGPYSTVASALNAKLDLAGGTMSGNLAMAGNRVTNLGIPASGTDAATKDYVDGVVQGLDVKASVRVATTANITLSGTQTIDTINVNVGDRVLVKDQSTPSQNGIYVVASGAWSRAADADSNVRVSAGLFTYVTEGVMNGDAGFVLTTNDPIAVDTTALTFMQFSGAGQINAGAGLTKTGNSLDVGAGTGIQVNADSIQISPTYLGQASIDTLGTITIGTWQASMIDITRGGTGANTAAGARAALSVPSNTELADGLGTRLSTSGGTLTGNLSLSANRITSLGDPSSATDAANKQYVDNVVQGLDVKASVRVATTANITLSGTQTIDGVSVNVGDRVLVKDQSTPSQNGIYTVASGAWSRAGDADSNAEVSAGMFTYVVDGAINGDAGFVLTTNDPIDVGTTGLTFTQFSGAGQITAGTGLSKSGNTLSISTGYTGQSSITTVGTVTSGTWNGTAVDISHGGTGQSTNTAAFDALAPTTTQGDIIYHNGTDNVRLAKGTAGQVLSMNSGATAPEWSSGTLVPTGTILPFAGSSEPAGFVFCDGSMHDYDDPEYAALYAVIGVTFGGTVDDEFQLPDLQGRVPIGAGTGSGLTARTLGDVGGAETHTLTESEIPSHHHGLDLLAGYGAGGVVATSNSPGSNTDDYTANAGGGGAHNNMQPFLVINFIIKL